MRGSPPLRVLLVVMLLLCVLFPLRRLTTQQPEKPVARSQTLAPRDSNVHLVLTATSVPFTFEVSHLGKTIWQGEGTESSVGRDVTMAFPTEGIDLLVQVKWKGSEQGAVRLDVTMDHRYTMTKTIWGAGGVDDVLTFAKP